MIPSYLFPVTQNVYRQLCRVTPEKGIHQGSLPQSRQTSSCRNSRSLVLTPACVIFPLLLYVLSKDLSATFHHVCVTVPVIAMSCTFASGAWQCAACTGFLRSNSLSFIAPLDCVQPRTAVASVLGLLDRPLPDRFLFPLPSVCELE